MSFLSALPFQSLSVIARVDQVTTSIPWGVADTALGHIALGGSIATHALHPCEGPPLALILPADLGAKLYCQIFRNIIFYHVHFLLPFVVLQDKFDSQITKSGSNLGFEQAIHAEQLDQQSDRISGFHLGQCGSQSSPRAIPSVDQGVP